MKTLRTAIVLTALAAGSVRGQIVGLLSDSARVAFYREHASEYAEEARAIASAGGSVSRDGGTLLLRLGNGKTTRLTDTLAEGDQHHRFLYAGYQRARRLHVVEQWFYEGSLVLLYQDRSGRAVAVPGRPLFSPGGTRFVAASEDLEAGYAPNRLEVWTVTSHGLHRDFMLDGGDRWAPVAVEWERDDVICYTRKSINQGRDVVTRTPRCLQLSNGHWHVRSRAP